MPLTKKNAITILIGIVFLGAILRFYHLGSTSFVADEFLDINSSYAYAKTGEWQNWDFNFGLVNEENAFSARDERAWIYKWQVAQILKIFPLSETSARTVSMLWGIISIILIYFVATYFTKKREIGLLAAFLFAVSITGIIFDRRLRMYAMFFPVYLSFSWMTYRLLEEKYRGKIKALQLIWNKLNLNLIYLIPALILGVASLLTHQLAANMAITILLYAVVNLTIIKRKNKSLSNKYSLILGLFILGYALALIFIPKNLSAYTAGLEFFNMHLSYLEKVFADYSHILIAILLNIIGIYYLYKKEKLEKEALWLIVSFWGILFCALFLWNRTAGDQYIFFIESFGIILIASGLYALLEFLRQHLKVYSQKAFVVPLILAGLILPDWGYFFQEANTYRQTSESESANYKKVFTYWLKARQPEDVLITRNFRNFYWKGAQVKVFDFGGELAKEKLSLEKIQKITEENLHGWFIISDNDDAYISNEAMDYVNRNWERVSNPQVRGKIMVYRW